MKEKLKIFSVFFSILILVFYSCTQESKHKGYSRTWTGIYYKLHYFGEDDIKPKPTDYVTVDLIYKTMKDSAFFVGRRVVQLTEPEYRGSIDECFVMLSKGDCATFILNADNFFKKTLETDLPSFFNEKSEMKVVVYMIDIKTSHQFEKEKEAFLTWVNDFGEYESNLLNEYISNKKIGITPTKSGIYYIKIRDGNGTKVEKNDTLLIEYEGRFLNGDYFDSTKKRNQPFEYVYGEEWQLIDGLVEAVGMMCEGEKAIFIIPSKLAFGMSGSSTGIIPPYTSVIFEIELLKINKSIK